MPFKDTSTGKTDPVRFKFSTTAGEIPSLHAGEIAINHADGKIFIGDVSGTTNSIQATLEPYRYAVGPEAWPVTKLYIASAAVSGTQTALFAEEIVGGTVSPQSGPYAVINLDKDRVYFLGKSVAPIIYNHTTGDPPNIFLTSPSSVLGSSYNGFNHFNCHVLPGGKVVHLPWKAGVKPMVYDTATDSWSLITDFVLGGDWAYNGSTMISPWKCVLTPLSPTSPVVVLDFQTGKIRTCGAVGGSGSNRGGVLLPDGRVMFNKNGNNGTIQVFNPLTGTTLTGPTVGFTTGTGCLDYSGKVFIVPYTSAAVPRFFDPSDNSIADVPAGIAVASSFPNGTHRNATLGPEGLPVWIDYDGDGNCYAKTYEPESLGPATLGTLPAGYRPHSQVLGCDGWLYGSTASATGTVQFMRYRAWTNAIHPEIALSLHYNRPNS